MLGAQDFCGYYDWTFHHVRKNFGEKALSDLWSFAVGRDSQSHYIELGSRHGMKGLFEAWRHTGEDEQCDWTFTLDEARNVLRWDMRKCPSKGFLLEHDLHSDEDYCDHCIGWEKSMLGTLGMEMVHHEHNHCGQCWGEIRIKGKPYETLKLDCDIRHDPRWRAGFVDQFVDQDKSNPHPLAALKSWLGGSSLVLVQDGELPPSPREQVVPLLTAASYVRADIARSVVMIESPPHASILEALSRKLHAVKTDDRPCLLYPYVPKAADIPFTQYQLPRPLAVLPMLIHVGSYEHKANSESLTTLEWMQGVADAINRH